MVQYLVNFLNLFQGLRKTIIMLALMIVSVILLIKGYINRGNFTDLLKNTILGYFGSNSIEHFTAMVKEHLVSKNGTTKTVETPVIDTTVVEA